MKKLMIIGGGAAGLAAAVAAADALRAASAWVRCGRGRRRRGGMRGRRAGGTLHPGHGQRRCNSNAQVDAAAYRNAAFVGAALDSCGARAACAAATGRPGARVLRRPRARLARGGRGRLYPLANKATSVLEVLRAAASDAGVREECGREAVRLDAPAQGRPLPCALHRRSGAACRGGDRGAGGNAAARSCRKACLGGAGARCACVRMRAS
ncbi:MAG: hypothetical protein ACLR3C_05620 [Eggerthella lenta]